jgi:hypothetical protein
MLLLKFIQLSFKLFRNASHHQCRLVIALVTFNSLYLLILNLEVFAKCQRVAKLFLKNGLFLLYDFKVVSDLIYCEKFSCCYRKD